MQSQNMMTRLYTVFEPGVSCAVLHPHSLTWCGGELRSLLLSLSKITVMAEGHAKMKSSIPHSLTPPKDLKEEIFCYIH